MAKFKIKPPKSLKSRLRAVAKAHDFASEKAVTAHFIERGLQAYGADPDPDPAPDPEDDLAARLDQVVDEQGYSSRAELIEHLLLRGLRAYEEHAEDPEALQARLRGLGYID